jgi:hypothetical protein
MPMQTLHVRLLRERTIAVGKKPLSIGFAWFHPVIVWLLSYYTSPRPRQQLTFSLWPDTFETKARTNVYNLTNLLRHASSQANDPSRVSVQASYKRPNLHKILSVPGFRETMAYISFRISWRAA